MRCIDKRKCFAKSRTGGCGILSRTYKKNGECPFCKPKREITRGKMYPYSLAYIYSEANLKEIEKEGL